MKIKFFFMLLLSVATIFSCEGLLSDGQGDTDGVQEQEGNNESGVTPIGNVTSDGAYTLKGKVVAVGSQAYILADKTGAILVYGSGHGRQSGEVIKAKGTVSRYQNYNTNVLQLKTESVEVLGETLTLTSSPTELDATAFDALVGQTASCEEVSFEGLLTIDGQYVNVKVTGAYKTASFKYVSSSDYSEYAGKYVRFTGFVVGTYKWLYVMPASIEVCSGSSVDIDSDPTTKKWMELPAMTTAGLDYYCHSFDIDGLYYRNYSFGWDDSNKVAYWVAYPLCGFYTYQYAGKNVRHEEYFIKDPLLGLASPRPGSGYAGDYDRGHQIPSADRQCSELANGQTYYGTNMTAQSNPLNGGPWNDLEGAIRSVANSSDTTYVVTGCYVGDSTEWSTDSDGMQIKVPTAYFKAVLVLKDGNWTGGAYWTPHTGYSSSYSSWAISIDELEQKTGLDLYVNLPDKIGTSEAAAIEAATSTDERWWK